MAKVLATVVAWLVLGGAASVASAADPMIYRPLAPPYDRVGGGNPPSWLSPERWRRDHSADDLNREALRRAIGTAYSGADSYGGSGIMMNRPTYPGVDRTTITTATTTFIYRSGTTTIYWPD